MRFCLLLTHKNYKPRRIKEEEKGRDLQDRDLFFSQFNRKQGEINETKMIEQIMIKNNYPVVQSAE